MHMTLVVDNGHAAGGLNGHGAPPPADDLPPGLHAEEVPRPPPANHFGMRSMRSLSRTLRPVPWVCRRLHLAPGRPATIVGYAGSGKTLLMADLALAVSAPDAMPLSFWGGLDVERRGKVAIFDLEVGEYLTEQRLLRLGAGHNIDLEAWDERLFVTCHPDLSLLDKGVEQKLAEQLEGYTLALFDSLTMLLDGSDENSASVSKTLRVLARVSERTGCAMLVLHHEGKPPADGTQREARFRGRGSSAIQGMWSSQWVVTPQGEGAVSVEHGKSHWGKAQEPWACRFVDVGEFDPELGITPGLRIERHDVADVSAEQAEQEPAEDSFALRAAMRRAIDAIRAEGRITRKGLDTALKGPGNGKSELKNKAIALLVERGRVVRVHLKREAWFAIEGTDEADQLRALAAGEGRGSGAGESVEDATLSPGSPPSRGEGRGAGRKGR